MNDKLQITNYKFGILTFVISFIIYNLSFIISSSVFAADLTVTCASGGSCTLAPVGGIVFNDSKWLPGQTISRQISIANNNSGDDCNLYLEAKNADDPGGLAKMVYTVLNDGSSDLYGQSDGGKAVSSRTLRNFFDAGRFYLTVIPASAVKNINWLITFAPETGNEYQGTKIVFDTDLSFTCGVEPVLSPTPTVTPTEVPGPTETPGPGPSQTPTPTPLGGSGTATSQVIITTVINQTDIDINQEDEETPTPTGEVLGGDTGPILSGGAYCKNSWWWPLVVLVQIYLMALLIKNARKETVIPTLTGNLIVSTLSIYIILQILCFWTYALLPFCVGVIGFYLLYKKIIVSFAGSKLLYN